MINSAIERFVGKKLNFSSVLKAWEVYLHIFQKGFFPALRGLLFKIIIGRSKGLLFVAKGVKILCPWKLNVGKSFYIGQHSYVDCMSINGVNVGDRVTIREGAWIQISSSYSNPGDGVYIGDNVYIGPRSVIGAAAPIRIGDRCQIGASVSIIAENHKFESNSSIIDQGVVRCGIDIGDDCWIGNNVIILDGVTVGAGCVLGAGAVVTKSLPDNAVAVGNPAKVIKFRN